MIYRACEIQSLLSLGERDMSVVKVVDKVTIDLTYKHES